MSDVETKLATARTRLILDKLFLGTLVLRLPMVQADTSKQQNQTSSLRYLEEIRCDI